MKSKYILSAFLLLMPLAAQADEGSSLSVILENDSFIDHIDRHYTNGLYFAWTGAPETRDDSVAGMAQDLMLPQTGDATWRSNFFAGQSMFTPENLHATVPPGTDRPYAGWLYAGARIYRDSGTALDTVEATIGMVGPASLAGDLQQSWHGLGLLGGIYPNGWHYQLHDEPGLVLANSASGASI